MPKPIAVIALLVCLFAPCAGAGDAARLDAYFPLAPGTTWTYTVTIKPEKGPAEKREQVVKVESRRFDKLTCAAAGENAYAVRDDGVYIIGVIQDGKLQRLDEAQKVVPADPKLGDKWTYREADGVTSAACLGKEKIKVAAGEFEAAKIYLVTARGADGGDRREVYRWFAPGVGPVKGSVTVRHQNADGLASTTEMTMELASYKLGDKPGAAAAARKATPDSLFSAAEAAARKGDHKTALERYNAAIALAPKTARLHAYKTLSLIATHQFDQAASEIDKAMELEPKEFRWHEIAGQLKIARGDIAPGKALYDQAAALSPRSAGAIYTDLAAALATRKDDRLAPDIERSLKLAAHADPPGAEALFVLGQSYVNAGRPEARQYLQQYIEVASKLPEGRRDERKITLARQLIKALDAVKGL